MNYKSLGASLTAAALSLSLALPVRAAAPSLEEAVQTVNVLGILVGDEQGRMNLDQLVDRAQFVTMTMKATPSGKQIGQSSVSPYPDVPRTHWASGYVEAAVRAGLISGYSDGTFRPDSTITLAEGATIALRLLGYGPRDFSGAYPTGQLSMFRSLKLDQSLTARNPQDVLTRQDSMYLFYNLMTADTKAGVPYLTTLGYPLNASGEIDLPALVSASLDGPIAAAPGWQDQLPFAADRAKVIRQGRPAKLADLQPTDVIYWNRELRTLWAYADQVTGTIQAIAPNTGHPASVMVAGTTYPLETSSAALALSDLGSFRVGDSVTLLLGRDGRVAAVTEPAVFEETLGLVTAVRFQPQTGPDGHSTQVRTAQVLATDGQIYSYPCSGSVEEGDLVHTVLDGNGTVQVRLLTRRSLSGTVDAGARTLGSRTFAPQTEILDLAGETGLPVYLSRLDGVTLSSDQVLAFRLDPQGRIDRLILDDVTGDLWHYGLLTDHAHIPSPTGFGDRYSYAMDLGGTPVLIPQSGTGYPAQEGPIRVLGAVQAPEKLYSLVSAGAGIPSGNRFLAQDGQRYPLADGVLVYEHHDGEYFLTTWKDLDPDRVQVTGWYDKAPERGGQVRVLLAEPRP